MLCHPGEMIHGGKGAQMYVDGNLWTADKVADVVDALRSYLLHRAQGGAIGLLGEPRVEILASVDPVVREEVGDGMGRRDLLSMVELHGDGEVFRGKPALEPTDCSRIRPARLQPEKPWLERRLVAPGLEADVADDCTHVVPSAGPGKRTVP